MTVDKFIGKEPVSLEKLSSKRLDNKLLLFSDYLAAGQVVNKILHIHVHIFIHELHNNEHI